MAANKLEYLNSFFSQRLLAVAEEIFQIVKDTITEYQEAIDRTKQENHYLKKMLMENDMNIRAAELPNYQEPLDTKPTIIQVEVELSPVRQDAESQNPLNNPALYPSSAACSKEIPNHFSARTIKEQADNDILNSSGVTVKFEQVDTQDICSDNANVVQNEAIASNHTEAFRDNQVTHLSQTNTSSDLISAAETQFQSQSVEKVVYCEFCGKPFGNRELLKQHLVVHQKDRPRPYRCDLCGKCYSYAQVLETHRRTHTGEKPFPCKFCGRRFNQKSHLKYHERIHTGERPFSCSICGKRFIQKSQIQKHNCNRYQIVQQ